MREIKDYTIVFYNVENLFDTENDPFASDDEYTPLGYNKWTEERYLTKIKNISKVLKGIDPELPLLVGLCEVENKEVLIDLVNSNILASANYDIVHYNSPDTRGIDVALIYKKEYFEVLESESLAVLFDNHPDVLTRDILYVKGIVNQEEIHIFVNHWSSRRKGKRETEYKRLTAARVLKDKILAIQETESAAKILIMGDFNDYPDNKSIRTVLEASLNPAADEFYNLSMKLNQSNQGTHFHDNEWGMLDQMMVSSSWLTSKTGNVLKKKTVDIYNDASVLFQHPKLGTLPYKSYSGPNYHGGYSDHLAISLQLAFKKKESFN